jgi:hypothetical protein
MNIVERSTASSHSGGTELPPVSPGTAAPKEKLSLSAIAVTKFGKFDIGQRARFLGRLLASVGPLALKVVSGGVFAKYVRHARSAEIPVSFEDAARATSSQVRDLLNYVEQSNPSFVEGLSRMSTTVSQTDVASAAAGPSISHQMLSEPQGPGRRVVGQQTPMGDAPRTSPSIPRIERENSPPGLKVRKRDLHDY